MKNFILILSTLGMFGSFAWGDSLAGMSQEQRQKMAVSHEKMAACLRTDRPVADCQIEMMKSCKEFMGHGACPMMEGKMKPGMRHKMMNDDEAVK